MFISLDVCAQPGTLDPSFGTGGTMIVPYYQSQNTLGVGEGWSVAVQTDGKIVTAGYGYDYTISQQVFVLTRHLSNGSLDPSFSGDGIAYINTNTVGSTNEYSYVYGMALTPDGKIVVTGYHQYYDGSNYNYTIPVVRINPDGTPDNSFDGDGIVHLDLNTSVNNFERGWGIAVQNDGKIVINGLSYNSAVSTNTITIVRLNVNGSQDNTFNGSGVVKVNFGNYSEGFGIKIQPDGKIVASGLAYNYINSNNYYDFAVVRLNTDGTFDNSFDGDGKTLIDVGGYYDYGWDVDLQQNGKIVVVGYIYNYNNSGSNYYDVGVTRLNSDGSLDNNFDGDGKKVIDLGASYDIFRSVVVHPDGHILLGGYSNVYNGVNYNDKFAIVKLNEDGNLDNNFDGDGIGLYDFGYYADAYDITLQNDGKIVAVGYASDNQNLWGRGIARILNDAVIYSISCPGNQSLNASNGQCTAIVNNIDPVLTPSGNFNLVNYTLSGATTGSGSGSVSGLSFNKGITTVTYTLANDASQTCSFTVTVNGIAAGALNFDGVNDYVSIPALNLNSNHVTIEAWIKPNGNQGDFDGIVFTRAGSSVAGIGIKSNNELEYHWNDNAVTYAWPSGAIVTPNQWSHVALVIEPTKATIYLNGIPHVNNVNHNIEEFNGITRIGKDDQYSSQDRQFNGDIEEVRIWNRSLSQAELQHNANCELTLPQTALIAYYKFNQGFSTCDNTGITSLTDASGNNNTGTLFNFALVGPQSNWVLGNITGNCSPFDQTPPNLTCPENVTISTTAGQCSSIVNFEATANDASGIASITYSQDPGTSFPKGTTTVNITATDNLGNSASCSFTVTVNDEQAPTVVQPDNITVGNAIGLCSASVNFSATATDNCSVTSLKYYLNYNTANQEEINFPKTFAVGSYIVTVVAKDAANNTTTKTFTITVNDTEKPTFTCPGNQNINLNATCQLLVPDLISGLTGNDNCGTVTFTQNLVPGTSLASSHNQTHNVVITASDGKGNTQTCTVVLTGKDVTKPTFTCPDNQNVNLNATCQLIVPNLISELTGNDNCGTVTFTQSPLAGASLASSHNQTHNVLITANDGNGNIQTCTVVLTGKDVTKPSFTCPYNQNVNLNTTCQLIVPNLISGLTGNDNCGTVTFTQSPVAGASLVSSHNQTHNVVITANDGNGNTQTCTVVLTGKDVTKPTFICPNNRNVNLNGTCQLIVPSLIYGLTGNDNCGIVTFTQTPVAGTSFASSHNQTQNVLITANDGNGNIETCTVVLTAKDVTLPVITCPSPKTISCDASILPANTGSATATDNCGGVLVITYSDVSGQDPDPSHAGYYNYTITRTWKAMDVATNTSTCNQTITVQDITKPMITCPANKLNIPFDFGQLYATIAIGTATATDNCAATANIAIAGTRGDNVVITNQQYPLGQTTIAWSATDPSDNSDGCTQTITVRKRNTTVTYTGDMTDSKICVQYSDIINLQAKLTDNEGLPIPNNISGRTITFQLLSGTTVLRSKTATTDANGVAIDTFKVEQAPGLYSVKTIFAGDGYFNGSNDQDNCEVKQEDADVEYNGSQYFTTSSSTTMAGSVTLAASLNDINDGSDVRGDIRKAKATFRDGGPGGNVLGSANLPVGLVNPNVLTNGLSATTQNYTLNTNEAGSGGKIFQVWVGASDHYKGADAGPTPVTLALPGLDFVTGGGHLVVTNSAGTYAGTLNSKMNFGFTMKWNKSGKSLQGNINIVFRKWQLYNGVWQWRVYQVKSNAINSMAVVEVGSNGQPVSGTNPAAFRKAIINTKANLKDVTDPLSNIDLGGNHNLTLDAWDHITANGGVSDKISVTFMGAATNELLFSSSWISNATAAQTITGGNINVRNGTLSSSTSINSITKNGQMEVAVKENAFVVKAYPNPTEHEFTLIVNSSLDEKIVIQLYDAVGRKIQTLSANANEIIRFGEKLKTGVYIAKVIQGNRQESIKLIKQ